MKSYSDEEILELSGSLSTQQDEIETPDKVVVLLQMIAQKLDSNGRDIASLSKVDSTRKIRELIGQLSTDIKIGSLTEKNSISLKLSEIIDILNKPVEKSRWVFSVKKDKNGDLETIIAEKE